MKTIIAAAMEKISAIQNPIQTYVDAPKEGRMAPQPNENMAMTRFVKRVLRLK